MAAFGGSTGFSTPAFGASPGFGFGAPSTGSAFGGTPAPAFGASGSTPAFGFGATPAASAPSLFGSNAAPMFGSAAASTPSLFGSAPAASPTPSLFGSSTPAFGAQSSPSLFGASAPATATASFGGPAASSAPNLFGTSTAGAFGTSLFGQPQTQPAAGSNLFSSTTTQMAPPAFGSMPQADVAVREINEIRAAYTPTSQTYKFQHLFLNVVENPSSRIKPANVDEIRWRQVLAQAGGPDNPDKLWPVLAVGFKDLLSRSAAQQQAVEENQARLRSLSDLQHRMSRQHSVDLKGRALDVQKRHIELSHKLLHVMRLIDALESRLASSLGYRGDLSRSKEHELSRSLSVVEAGMAQASSSSLQRRLGAVASSARSRLSSGASAAASGGGSAQQLDGKSMQQLFAVLKEHAEGVRQLQEVLKRDQLDVQIIKQQAA